MEHIREVILGIDPVAAAALDEGVNDGAAPSGVGMADKEPAAFADHVRSHVIFYQVGINFKPAVPWIADQGREF